MKPFDRELYGAFVRLLRRKRGEDAQGFAIAVMEQTGIPIGTDELKAIETGDREPSVTQFMALNEALFGGAYSPRAFALGAGDMGLEVA